jgi:hypothetical protein
LLDVHYWHLSLIGTVVQHKNYELKLITLKLQIKNGDIPYYKKKLLQKESTAISQSHTIGFSNIQFHLRNQMPLESVLMVGDFNCVLDPFLDKTSFEQGNMEGSAELSSLINEFVLTDIFRIFHNQNQEYTFRSNAHQSASRIDRGYLNLDC